MARVRPWFAALLLVSPWVSGCATEPQDAHGDCNARIRWDGTVFRPHNEVRSTMPRGERLGSGDVLDSSVAVTTVGDWRGVYVAEGVDESSWPDVLRAR